MVSGLEDFGQLGDQMMVCTMYDNTALSLEAYPDHVPEPMRSFFTFRPGQPVYKTGPTRPDHWGWLEVYPQHGYGESAPGTYEMATVGVLTGWLLEGRMTCLEADRPLRSQLAPVGILDLRINPLRLTAFEAAMERLRVSFGD